MKHFYTKLFITAIILLSFSWGGFAQNQKYCGFDGTNDYIKYTDDATLGRMDGATDYTIEAWVYPIDGTVAEYDRVLQRYYSFNIQMYDGNNDGNVEDWYFVAIDGGGNNHFFNTEGDATLTLDAWNHIAIICNSTTGTLKLFVNGTDVTKSGGYSNYTLRSSHSSDNLYIGQKGNGASYLGGYVDEVRLKNVAENPSNLHYHTYDNEYTSDANTAGLFHFNEGSGTSTENEASGSNASLYNGTSWINWDAHEILPLSKYTWNGTSSDWSSASNWSMNATPTSKSFVEIPSGTSNDPTIGGSTNASADNLNLPSSATLTLAAGATLDIYGTFTNNGTYTDNGSVSFKGSSAQTIPAATFNNVKIDNANGVTLGGAVTIKGTLTLSSGIITSTSTNILTFASTANAVSGGSNTAYVDGPMEKVGSTDFVFPCGDGGKYARIGISNLSGSETFTAEYINGTPANNSSIADPLTKVSDKESWSLERAGSATADVTIYWEDSKWSGIGDFDDLRLAHWNSTTSEWEAVTGTSTHSGAVDLNSSQSGSITVAGVSSFSPFSFGSIDNTTNTLPIELISFTLASKDNAIELSWQTASELNNQGFEIQRSNDTKNWETLGFVNGMGNSNIIQNYSFVDNTPNIFNYYRLKQIDFDGAFEFSEIRFLKLGKTITISSHPNPVENILQLDIDNAKLIEIYDVAAKLVRKQNMYSRSIDVSDLQKGFYFFVVTKNDGTQARGEFLKH